MGERWRLPSSSRGLPSATAAVGQWLVDGGMKDLSPSILIRRYLVGTFYLIISCYINCYSPPPALPAASVPHHSSSSLLLRSCHRANGPRSALPYLGPADSSPASAMAQCTHSTMACVASAPLSHSYRMRSSATYPVLIRWIKLRVIYSARAMPAAWLVSVDGWMGGRVWAGMALLQIA